MRVYAHVCSLTCESTGPSMGVSIAEKYSSCPCQGHRGLPGFQGLPGRPGSKVSNSMAMFSANMICDIQLILVHSDKSENKQ